MPHHLLLWDGTVCALPPDYNRLSLIFIFPHHSSLVYKFSQKHILSHLCTQYTQSHSHSSRSSFKDKINIATAASLLGSVTKSETCQFFFCYFALLTNITLYRLNYRILFKLENIKQQHRKQLLNALSTCNKKPTNIVSEGTTNNFR